MTVYYAVFVQQLDALLGAYEKMRASSKYSDLSDVPTAERQALITRALSAVERITGSRSTYSKHAEKLVKNPTALHYYIHDMLGVVLALRDDLKAGSLRALAEVVHAEVFSDFLDMSRHLSDAGYKDAAAVIAGSTLESHLRGLALQSGVKSTDATGRPVKADKLNAELAKAGAYGVLDQKTITANLDLRNKAAHGNYNEYTKEQVANLIVSIEEFIKRTPA